LYTSGVKWQRVLLSGDRMRIPGPAGAAAKYSGKRRLGARSPAAIAPPARGAGISWVVAPHGPKG